MAVLLKDIYNREFLSDFGSKIQSVYKPFNTAIFIDVVMDKEWNNLPLKARMRKITKSLGPLLPGSYKKAIQILSGIADNCVGFPYLIFPDFVAFYGLEEKNWELSMQTLEYFTQKSSAEFAIRSFILKDPKKVMKQMKAWAKNSNEHVRRLSSEGCRPRLPWGESLPVFKKDPAPVFAILELLKDDSSLYVRKSVANNLNDISKDNPDMVLSTAKRWKGVSPNTDWIIRRGCRTLVKKANSQALKLFNYASPSVKDPLVSGVSLSLQPQKLHIGDSGEIRYNLTVRLGKPIHIRIEYGIDFVKANGHISHKAFLISDKTIEGGLSISGTRLHRWVDLTTRRHYPGEHKITLVVNGQEIATKTLKLLSKKN
ncbi:DNA alkylation repair protein [Treponema primitia]|uniref:DNA alkylation repair protein n=1 Tax=Treponema primitia TaxID=88058 RepID=UPI00397F0942